MKIMIHNILRPLNVKVSVLGYFPLYIIIYLSLYTNEIRSEKDP